MATKSNKNIKITQLEIGSELTIDTIKDIHNQFLKVFKEKSNLKLTSKKLEVIDLSGIQFISFAKEMTLEAGYKIELNLTLSSTAKDLIKKTGFNYIFEN